MELAEVPDNDTHILRANRQQEDSNGTVSNVSQADAHNEHSTTAQTPAITEDFVSWLQVVGGFCLNFNTWGVMSAYGVFQTYYSVEMLRGHSTSSIAWIGSVQAFLMFLLSFLTGPWFDAGHLRILLLIGTALSVAGFFLTSICRVFWQCFLAQGVLMGLGFGCLYLPAPALVSMHFEKHRSLANGIASTGSGVGGVVFPVTFTQLLPRLGFGWTTRVLAFIFFATSVVPLIVMRYPHSFVATSIVPASEQRPEAAEPENKRSFDSAKAVSHVLIDPLALRDWPYVLLTTGLLAGYMGIYIVLYYIDLFGLPRATASATLSSYLLVILNAASMVGRVALTAIADLVGPIHILSLTALVSAVFAFCLIAMTHGSALVGWTILFGVTGGAFMGLPAAGVVSACSVKTRIGTRLGMTLRLVGCGVLVAGPIAGAILDSAGGWNGLIIWCAALLIVSALLIGIARFSKTGAELKPFA